MNKNRIDNDETKGIGQPFLILAHVRTGGTFLAHALSNHEQIFSDRGETLHHLSSWRQAGIEWYKIMKVIWNLEGYHSVGFRAIYTQALKKDVWNLVKGYNPRIIHLIRQDETRQAVSFGYHQMIRAGILPFHAVHSFELKQPRAVNVDIETMLRHCLKVRGQIEKAKGIIEKYSGEILQITYEELTGNRFVDRLDGKILLKILDFLGVQRVESLPVGIVRDVNLNLRDWFLNWNELKTELERNGFQVNG